jgi:hypothetical protein
MPRGGSRDTRDLCPTDRAPDRRYDLGMRRLLAATATIAFLLGGCAVSAGSSPIPTLAVTPSPSPSPTAAISPSPAPVATAKPVPTPGPCASSSLAARIVSWDAGAGHRTAHVELTNSGSAACEINALDRPQLINGNGSVLINGAPAAASPTLTLAAGAVVKTLVQDDNYCGPAPTAPVTVAFVFSNGARLVASPVSPTDVDGVPPCFGSTGAGVIEMQAWAP